MARSAVLETLAPWYGNKRAMAAVIDRALGDHSAYFEPFCGGMAPLLGKRRASNETVNDLHGDLILTAMVCADPALSVQLHKRLRRTPASEAIWEAARGEIQSEKPPADPVTWARRHKNASVERAFCFLVYNWLGRNGFSGTEQKLTFAVRWDGGGGAQGVRWESVIRSVPWWRLRLKGVTILNRDGFDVLASASDRPDTAVYVDSPYLQKQCRYIHEFLTLPQAPAGSMFPEQPDDHSRLACLCDRFTQAAVVVSYRPHPRLMTLYPMDRWRHVYVDVHGGLACASGTSGGATELLLLNRKAAENFDAGDEHSGKRTDRVEGRRRGRGVAAGRGTAGGSDSHGAGVPEVRED